MAEVSSITFFVSWASKLVLELYSSGATSTGSTRDLTKVAKAISLVSITIKQLGSTIREDDNIPSAEAVETIQDILTQCKTLLTEVEDLVCVPSVRFNEDGARSQAHGDTGKWSLATKARVDYILGHLDSLKCTLSVMLQTIHTVQIMLWARTRPTISPQRAADAVNNERLQLEMLIIEQQLSLVTAAKLHDDLRRTESFSMSRLLIEEDHSRSLARTEEEDEKALNPANLFPLQHPGLTELDASHTETECLASVRHVSVDYLDDLLARWTRLREIEERIADAELEKQSQRRATQQPSVDTDDSDDQIGALPRVKHRSPHLNAPIPRRPPSIQPLFEESPTLPIPVPETRYGPSAPLSPASSISPRTSVASLPSPSSCSYSPQSPRSSISAPPVSAAAAVTAKEEDDSADLGIPWRVCHQTYYWEYVDGRITRTNTHKPSSSAFTERNSWTEIMASWVCKEAIKEAGYQFTQVKKDRNDGGRTKLETCFCIQRPSTYPEIKRLVDRTVEIYRQNRPASPPSPSPKRRISIDRSSTFPTARSLSNDRDRTPNANVQNSTLSRPPFPPPPLDRSTTFPGPTANYNPFQHAKPQQSTAQFPYPPYSHQHVPSPLLSPHDPRYLAHIRPPLRQAQSEYNPAMYSSASTTSDSDNAIRPRRRHGSSSSYRRGSSSHSTRSNKDKKKGHQTVGTLAKVGGLAVLLDGLLL